MNEIKSTRILHCKGFSNKKKLFETLAEVLSNGDGPSFSHLLDSLNAREKLGSTCIGKGVAIPHCKLDIEAPIAALMVLEEAIKYSELCNPNVDIIFALVVPKDDCDQHLHLLSGIAKLCTEEHILDGIRRLESDQEIIDHISSIDSSLAKLL